MRGTAFTIALGLLVLADGADALVKLNEAVPVSKAVASAVVPRSAEIAACTVPTNGPVDAAVLVKAVAAASESLSPAARLEVAVSEILAAASLEHVRAIVPLFAQVDLAAVTPTQIVAAMERIAEAVRGTYTAKDAARAVCMARVVSPAWYQIKLYKCGTTLWALAEKAKWYAERGDAEKVRQLYARFVTVLARTELRKEKKGEE